MLRAGWILVFFHVMIIEGGTQGLHTQSGMGRSPWGACEEETALTWKEATLTFGDNN